MIAGSDEEGAGDRGEEDRPGGLEEEEPAGAGQGAGADQDADHQAGRAEGGASDQRGQLGLDHLLPAGQADPGEEPSQGLSIFLLLTNQSDDKFLLSEFLAFTFLRPKSV